MYILENSLISEFILITNEENVVVTRNLREFEGCEIDNQVGFFTHTDDLFDVSTPQVLVELSETFESGQHGLDRSIQLGRNLYIRYLCSR